MIESDLSFNAFSLIFLAGFIGPIHYLLIIALNYNLYRCFLVSTPCNLHPAGGDLPENVSPDNILKILTLNKSRWTICQ